MSDQQPLPQQPNNITLLICPHCSMPFTDDVGTHFNPSVGLVTFFHARPECMRVINFQALPMQKQPDLVQVPGGIVRPS